MVYLFVWLVLRMCITTFDMGAWYAGRSSLTLLAIVLVGVWGFRVTTAGRSMFRDVLSEP